MGGESELPGLLDHPDDPTPSIGTHLDRRGAKREQARLSGTGPIRRRAPGYGSGGLGSNPRGVPPNPLVSSPMTGSATAVESLDCDQMRPPATTIAYPDSDRQRLASEANRGFGQGLCVAVGSPAEPASSAAQTVTARV
jgi:hypothetical protein